MVQSMEIVLLWLDELDDLIFAAAAFWRGVCRAGLAAGLTAAVLLLPITGAELRFSGTLALSAIATVSVLAWLSAAVTLMRRMPASA